MKYPLIGKGLAIFLAALLFVVAAAGAVGIVVVTQAGLYTRTPEQLQEELRETTAWSLADHVLERYTARKLGNCSAITLEYLGLSSSDSALAGRNGVDPDSWCYGITDASGKVVENTYTAALQGNTVSYSFCMSCDYPVEVTAEELADFDASASHYQNDYCYADTEYFLYYFPSPEFTVTVKLLPDALQRSSDMNMEQLTALYEMRYLTIAAFALGLILFLLCLVYLGFSAGRSHKGGDPSPGGLNRMPLDLYLGIAGLSCFGAVWATFSLLDQALWTDGGFDWGLLALAAAVTAAAAVIAVCFFFAAAAQLKVPGGFWRKNSILGRIGTRILRSLVFLGRKVRRLYDLLPLIWQWLLTAAAMVFVPLLLGLLASSSYGFGQIFWVLLTCACIFCDIAIVLYGAYAFGVLQKGAEQMAQGDLREKLSCKYLIGCFRDFACHLNALSDAAVLAAQKQMQSERMKTELITNVSHDIKTPLTSIINYVDLLEKPHTQEEGQQYLEVLSRQSQRLKKLIEDLMEMSKASTGNMAVDIEALDLAESVNQALGEFADKLEQSALTPVLNHPEQPAMVAADGRVTWRVLSNLLGNIVKYALPGTRVYVDMVRQESKVQLSLKNISREALNISAQELTERFVRGDASRNTEGSGLGLNIAKSLMELQGGSLELLVDGDLFKVTLTFPVP